MKHAWLAFIFCGLWLLASSEYYIHENRFLDRTEVRDESGRTRWYLRENSITGRTEIRTTDGGKTGRYAVVGGTAGTALNLIFPDIPLALAVACLMAAVPGALLPIPLTLAVIVLLITGVPATEAIPVFLAVIVAHAITNGLGLLGGSAAKQPAHADEASKSN